MSNPLTRSEVVENYKVHIAPKYPNGTGSHKPVLVKLILSPHKFVYGIRFEIAPHVGEVRQGDRINFEILEIL